MTRFLVIDTRRFYCVFLLFVALFVSFVFLSVGCSVPPAHGPESLAQQKEKAIETPTLDASDSFESKEPEEGSNVLEEKVSIHDASQLETLNQEADATREEPKESPIKPGPPSTFPLERKHVQLLGPASQLDLASAFWQEGKTTYVIFESANESFSKIAMYLSSSTGGPFSPPKKLTFSNKAIVSSPSVFQWKGKRWLYFVEADSLRGTPTLRRARIEAGKISASETLTAVPGLGNILSWPKWYAWRDKKIYLVYRDSGSFPMFSQSLDGKSFTMPKRAVSQRAALATLGVMSQGTLVYTYQHPTAQSAMTSYYLLSKDGKTWSSPKTITLNSSNVHDTTILPRPDGGVDVYYIYPKGLGGFRLFRRYISPAGQLGVEQQLTAQSLGEPSKPEAKVLQDGRILLGWSEISKRAQQGYPSEQRFQVTLLRGFAPKP